MAPKPKKTLDEQLFDAEVKVARAESQRDVWTTVEGGTKYQQDVIEHISSAFYYAGHLFNARIVPCVPFLRAVDKVIREDKDTTITGSLCVLAKYPRKQKATPQDDSMWLRAMNVEIAAFLSPDVELVFKDKKQPK